MKKIVLTFGLIAGAMLALMMLMTLPFYDQIGFDKAMVVTYTTMVVAFLMIYFGVRSYRDNTGGGSVGFGRAFAIGILITCVASVCYVAMWQVMYYKVTPDFLDKCLAYSVEKTRKSGASEAEIAAKEKQMAEFKEMYKNPLINIAFTFLEPLPVGLLFTLITAGLLGRRRRGPGAAVA